ncbi:MAG: hypothetical protein FJY10_11715 [Bacteroidetes bacterium]|nr:hypothetical protein [Bacteroidota bacterium]
MTDFSKIISVSGKSGLFRIVSELNNAVLVESFTDKKHFPVFAHEKMSTLEEISVFTTGEDKPLKDIFKLIFEKLEGKATPPVKDNEKELKAFFEEILPDYDKDRVYASDIRKMVSWYNLLVEQGVLEFKEEEREDGVKNEE